MKIIENKEHYQLAQNLISEIQKSFFGSRQTIELLLVSLFARGHILIEDVPGVGKTTLARALAKAINCSFKRIQFTSDLLPSDIIGISIWDKNSNSFIFRPGPIFANLILADEINRGTPKTQSALLESMNEYQVTVDNITHKLPLPYMIIATQNPIEFYGVYPLPENELDRFMMSIKIGYPDSQTEAKIIRESQPIINVDATAQILNKDDVIELQNTVANIFVKDNIINYVVNLLNKTRESKYLLFGSSPRAGKHLVSAARALAFLNGRSFVLPDDIKALAKPLLSHRLMPKQSLNENNRAFIDQVIDEILAQIPVP
jgi:MoxR-like ATPase